MTTIASRDIQRGEELTVSYVDVFLPSKERKQRIRTWGFECACALCQGPRNETVAVSLPNSTSQKLVPRSILPSGTSSALNKDKYLSIRFLFASTKPNPHGETPLSPS